MQSCCIWMMVFGTSRLWPLSWWICMQGTLSLRRLFTVIFKNIKQVRNESIFPQPPLWLFQVISDKLYAPCSGRINSFFTTLVILSFQLAWHATAACFDKTWWSYVAFCVKGRRACQQPCQAPMLTIIIQTQQSWAAIAFAVYHPDLQQHPIIAVWPKPKLWLWTTAAPFSPCTESVKSDLMTENVNLHRASRWAPSSRRSL